MSESYRKLFQSYRKLAKKMQLVVDAIWSFWANLLRRRFEGAMWNRLHLAAWSAEFFQLGELGWNVSLTPRRCLWERLAFWSRQSITKIYLKKMKRCTTSSGHTRGRQQPDLLLLTHRATLGSAPFKHDSLSITNFFNKYQTTPQIFQVLRSSIALATISVSLEWTWSLMHMQTKGSTIETNSKT